MRIVIKMSEYREFNGEQLSSVSEVDTLSYVPFSRQLQSLIDAGKRLVASRRGYEFDSEDRIPVGYSDPTRVPNFDLADASYLQQKSDEALVNAYNKKLTTKQRLSSKQQNVKEAP